MTWLSDVRFGFRLLLRTPGFSFTAGLTLALGIGATTALFTVVEAVLLDPLPLPKSQALVQVWRAELPALTYGSASYARYLDWRREQRAFTDLGAWAPRALTLAGTDGPERVGGATASASFFRVVAAPASVGRWITDEDERPGAPHVAVISHAFWQRRYQGSAAVLGTTLTMDGDVYTIVGVAPAGFGEVWKPDVWIPLAPTASATQRDSNYLLSFGRLRDGESIDAARKSLAILADQMHRDHAEDNYTFTARPLYEIVTENAAQSLWVLLGATILLLVIACLNVANLLLARAITRERDVAIRASLGAGRGRLAWQVAAETIAIGALAAGAGLAVAFGLVRVFVALAPADFPRVDAIAVDLRVLGFSIAAAVAAALGASLAPVFHVMRFDVNVTMRTGGGRSATSGRARAASRALVTGEMALAVALVAAAGLTAKSVIRLQSQDLGLTHQPVLTFTVGLPPLVAPDAAAAERNHRAFIERVRRLPGITHASAINVLPIARTGLNGAVRRADQPDTETGVPVTEFRAVMDGYFDVMDMQLIAGRGIDASDQPGANVVAVVNDTLAARLFPGVDPRLTVGRRIKIGWLRGVTSEIVGVAASVRSRRPDAVPDPEVYVPFAQAPQSAMSYVVRASGDVMAQVAPIRHALREVTPAVALSAVRSFSDVVDAATRLSRLVSWLSVMFAGFAAALAVMGLYSVLSYAVSQREREFAIRAAVGATYLRLLAVTIREGLTLSVIGIAAGLLLATGASGVVGHLLYAVNATDPAVFGLAAVGLASVALAGCVIPGMRAARVNPVDALRRD